MRLIDDLAFELLKSHPFYSQFFRQCTVRFDNDIPNPAQVHIKDGVILTINSDLLKKYPLKTQVGIIEHEFQHIFRGHLEDYRSKRPHSYADKVDKSHDHEILNIALDAEINPSIKNLVDDETSGLKSSLRAKELQKQLQNAETEEEKTSISNQLKDIISFVFPQYFDLPTNQLWATYYVSLLDKQNSEQNQLGTADHSYFLNSLEDKEIRDSMVAEAVSEAKQGIGKIPVEVEKYLENIIKPYEIPWSVLLKQFIRSATKYKKENTWKKINRRFPEELPGVKRKPELKILVGLDASGSISDANWTAFWNEIRGIADAEAEVHVAEFDTEVHQYFKFNGDFKPRTSYGGTSFVPVHDLCIKDNFKLLIMLTDGYGEFPSVNDVRYDSIWVSTIKGFTSPYGRTIYLDTAG